MSRVRELATIVLTLGLGASTVLAESQADIASRENDEGKELMYGGKYPDASAKFRDAVARVPEPKYFFNLCTSLFQEGKFGEALTSCNSADKALTNAPDDKLKEKIDRLSQRVKDEAKSQGLDLQPVGGGGGDPNVPPGDPNQPPNNPPPGNDPNNPPPNNPPVDPNQPPSGQPPGQQPVVHYQPIIGRPPDANLFRAVQPDHNYTWTLGVDVFAGGASFQGNINGVAAFGNASGGVRVKSDYMINRPLRLGAEVWASYTAVTNNSSSMTMPAVGELDILDVGVGVYKHLCLRGVERLCLTPMIGAGVAFMDPNATAEAAAGASSQSYNYLTATLRGNLAAEIAFGRRYEHVFSVAIDARYFTASLNDPSQDGTDAPPVAVGLNDPGVIVTLSLGYTYRFNTPLGGRAFITLE